jgi:hypothetical protein
VSPPQKKSFGQIMVPNVFDVFSANCYAITTILWENVVIFENENKKILLCLFSTVLTAFKTILLSP